MYVVRQKQGAGTRMAGAVAAVALTAGVGGVLTGLHVDAERVSQVSSELVMIAPTPVMDEPPPKLEIAEVEDTPAPPTPAPLVAPEVEFVAEETPVITAPLADPAPIAAPPVPASSPITQSRSAPRLLASAKPDYPPASRRAGEQGTTQLDVCVSANGRVTSVSVLTSSGHSRLDDAAVRWIRGERFQPARVNGAAREVCGHRVFYEWSLRDV